MKKIIIRITVLLLIFVMTVAATTFWLNTENTDDMGDLDAASLPEVMVEIDGVMVNRMYGYYQELQVDFSRDSVTPMDTSREINLAIKPFEQDIRGFSYEIRSSDGERVLENQTVKNLRSEDSYLKATIQPTSSDMKMNQEYSLRIQLDLEDGPVYYYTRIVQRSRLHTADYVNFVESFYQKCLNKDTASELTAYVEPDSSITNSSFTNVSIKSSLDMITWGSLNPQMVRRGVPMIEEMNETTGSISLEYQISAKDTDGNLELYEVEEFYRLRYTQTRVMMLDFKRTTQQIFDGDLPVATAQGITLGVAPKDVQVVWNSNADIAAFVQCGDLWSYNHSSCKITKIFSFRTEDSSDERDDHSEHNMKILRVSESGDVDFVLYGYMNRGPHEGYMGIGVYRYNSVQNAVKEQVFIPSTLSYEFLKRDLEKLSYVTHGNQMFLLTEGKLYQIDIEARSYELLEDYIDQSCFVTSTDNSRAAWMKLSDSRDILGICEMDFETGQTRLLEAASGQQIQTLGYMNEDLIYGIADENDIVQDANGKTILPMNEIRIESFDGELKKSYSKQGMYVTQVNVTESLMEMQLSEKKGNSYEYRTSENIMNNKKAVELTVTQNMVYTDRRGFVVRLDFDEKVSNPKPVVVFAKIRTMEHSNIMDMGIEASGEEAYYVYAYGHLQEVFNNPADAILQADEQTGVVLNRAQQYVWERGNKKTKINLNVEEIPKIVRKGTLDTAKLADKLGESAEVLDLTGCSLDSVLYQVSMQRPVIAAIQGGKSLVIVGYDEYNTIVYNPEDKTTSYMGLQDSTNAFQEAGNIFISYIDK